MKHISWLYQTHLAVVVVVVAVVVVVGVEKDSPRPNEVRVAGFETIALQVNVKRGFRVSQGLSGFTPSASRVTISTDSLS